MKKLVLAACGFMAFCAGAEDVIVPVGETVVIQSGSYGKIFVNGICAIPDDAVVSCTSLMVASGNVQNVSFTIGKRAQLTVTGDTKTFIGYDNGGCTFTVDEDATMSVQSRCLVRVRIDNTKVSSYPVVVNLRPRASIVGNSTDSAFAIGTGGTGVNPNPLNTATTPEGVKASALGVTTTVNLDEGSELFFSSVRVGTRPDSRINFNGGRIRNPWNNGLTAMIRNGSGYSSSINHSTKLYLTSVNGNPIRLYKDAHAQYFFSQNSNGGMIIDGDIELDGVADNADNQINGLFNCGDAKYLNLSNVGSVTLKGSVCPKFTAENRFPATTKFIVEENAKLQLNGFNQTIAGLSGAGSVVNDVEVPATLTVANEQAASIGTLGANVALVKQGAGALAIGSVNSMTTTLDVQAGALSVANTGTFGTLALDAAAATVDLGALESNAVGTLALANYEVAGALSKLPVAYSSVADKSKLAQWTVTLDGKPYTALPLTTYDNWFWLGKVGLILVFK